MSDVGRCASWKVFNTLPFLITSSGGQKGILPLPEATWKLEVSVLCCISGIEHHSRDIVPVEEIRGKAKKRGTFRRERNAVSPLKIHDQTQAVITANLMLFQLIYFLSRIVQ